MAVAHPDSHRENRASRSQVKALLLLPSHPCLPVGSFHISNSVSMAQMNIMGSNPKWWFNPDHVIEKDTRLSHISESLLGKGLMRIKPYFSNA